MPSLKAQLNGVPAHPHNPSNSFHWNAACTKATRLQVSLPLVSISIELAPFPKTWWLPNPASGTSVARATSGTVASHGQGLSALWALLIRRSRSRFPSPLPLAAGGVLTQLAATHVSWQGRGKDTASAFFTLTGWCWLSCCFLLLNFSPHHMWQLEASYVQACKNQHMFAAKHFLHIRTIHFSAVPALLACHACGSGSWSRPAPVLDPLRSYHQGPLPPHYLFFYSLSTASADLHHHYLFFRPLLLACAALPLACGPVCQAIIRSYRFP